MKDKVVAKEVGVDPGGIERGVEGGGDQTTLYEILRKVFFLSVLIVF